MTRVNLFNPDLQILLRCRDAVDFHENIYLKEITVENLLPEDRQVKLFLHLDFSISGNDVGTPQPSTPRAAAWCTTKAPAIFWPTARWWAPGGWPSSPSARKASVGREGTFRDAEDGILSGNPIAQGSVDSVIGLTLTTAGLGSGQAAFWLAAAENWHEARRLDNLVKYKLPADLLQRTASYWQLWVRKETPPLQLLPDNLSELYRRSLLILSTQIDWQGGILAATDSDVIQFNRDTYAYIWPRDGALAAHALDLTGYPVYAQRFFEFMAKTSIRPATCFTNITRTAPWPPPGIPGLPTARINCPSRKIPPPWWSGPSGTISSSTGTSNSLSPFIVP